MPVYTCAYMCVLGYTYVYTGVHVPVYTCVSTVYIRILVYTHMRTFVDVSILCSVYAFSYTHIYSMLEHSHMQIFVCT